VNQFKSWDSFSKFNHEVTRQGRYLRTPEADEFLRIVASTCKSRIREVENGQPFWRAQLGHEWGVSKEVPGIRVPVAYPPSRMKPLPSIAIEGRANAKGIPCLYLATNKETAMSEVRPWIGAMVSLASFAVVRPLKVVDCSILHDQYFNLAFLSHKIYEPVPPDKIDDVVWAAIDGAFAEPVTRADETADYAATQIMAELFRSEGYDGVAYKSAFGVDGFNVALFDLDSAKQADGALYEVKDLKFNFEQRSNAYYVSSAVLDVNK
jgi:RES domain-containing protein